MEIIEIVLYFIVIFKAVLITRVIYLLYKIFIGDSGLITSENSLRTIFCVGSGGHTTELLRLTKTFNSSKYQPRLYILANNDVSSELKIHKNENGQTNYSLIHIPRSRNVKQSYWSSIITTSYATLCTIPIIYSFKPNIIICNGPGTCIPVCVVAFLMRCIFLLECRIVFIESICRVRTLSLSGKILQFFADIIVVQWPQLRDVCFRAKYFGRLT